MKDAERNNEAALIPLTWFIYFFPKNYRENSRSSYRKTEYLHFTDNDKILQNWLRSNYNYV